MDIKYNKLKLCFTHYFYSDITSLKDYFFIIKMRKQEPEEDAMSDLQSYIFISLKESSIFYRVINPVMQVSPHPCEIFYYSCLQHTLLLL